MNVTQIVVIEGEKMKEDDELRSYCVIFSRSEENLKLMNEKREINETGYTDWCRNLVKIVGLSGKITIY